MSRIPYVVKKFTTDDLRNVDAFALRLSDESVGEPYELKQVVPVVSDGDTYDVYSIYVLNPMLIHTNLWIDENTCDDKFLTVEQIKFIKELGEIEIGGETRKVKDVTISWDTETYENIYATIDIE